MNLKTKFTGIIRYFSLIFISLIAIPLAGQQAGSGPVITLVSPIAADSLNNSGRIIVSAEIVSNNPLQTFRIMHNETVFASETMIKSKQKDNNTYIIESLVPLQGGLNTIYVESKNSGGTATSEKRIINYRLEPFITWLTPAATSTTVQSGTVNIKAEIKTGIPLQNISMNHNGIVSALGKASAKPLNDDTYVLETTIELKTGKNNIYISADNTRGETRSVPRTITYSVAPVITIVSPSTRDSINNSGTVVVRAEIVSHRALQTFRVMHNETMFASEALIKPKQKDSITYIIESLVPLKGGLNTIYIEARNSAETAVSEKRVINYHNEPFVTWIVPATVTSTVESGNLNIKAEIRTIYPLQKVTVNLNGSGSGDEKSSVSRLSDDTFILEKSVKLNPGKNAIFISAGNAKGEYKSAPRTVTFGSPPIVTLMSPTSADSLNTSGTILVRAQIISSVGIQSFKIIHSGSTVINEAGTKPIQKDNSTYIIESLISINGGLNTVSVEVKNALGTESSEKRTITSQSQPFITWILPESVSTTTESGTLNVNAEIKTSLELQNVSLNLNGNIFNSEPADITRLNNETYIFKKTIPNILSAKNTVFISATNIRGTTTSDPRSISYAAGSRPVITIAATDSLNNSGILLFSAEIISQTKIQAVRLIHNGTVMVTETTKNPEQKDSITYIVKGLFPLRAGLNTIYLEAKNTIGTTSSEKRNIICQPAPIIRWISPATASSTAGSETLKIKAEITTSFDLLNAGVNINGAVIADPKEGITRVNNDTYTLERTVSLKAGENNIFLVADNARGTGNSTRRTVSYTPGIISEIKWITPADVNSDTRKSEFPASAAIKTRSDIKNMRLYLNGTELTAGDRSKTTKKNTQEYLYENILILKPGANTLELSAITGEGTITTDKRTITYTVPVLPVLAWQNPASNQSEVNQASLDIKMNIKSADELNNIAVYLNGKVLDNVNLLNSVRKENEDFVVGGTVVLKPGENTLYISAGNVAGLATSETRNIRYTVPSMPVIAWGNPETSVSALSASKITVAANITSTTELKNLKIYHNGNPLPGNPVVNTIDKQQGVYNVEKTINLSQGENRIYIEAENLVGKSTSETRSVVYAAPAAPVITWVAPSKPSTPVSLPSAKIRATVKSTEKLQSLMVNVNGASSEEVNQIIPTGSGGEYMVEKTINLQPGENKIFLLATNSIETTRSEERILTNPPASPPVISWTIPADPNPTVVSSDLVVIEACIKSTTELKLVQIFVDGVPQSSKMVFQATQSGDCNYILTESVNLKVGDNNIRINATNAASSEWSEVRKIRYQTSVAERRLALVFGNSDYQSTLTLKNPVNDANLIEGTLKILGFDVIKSLNAKKADMEKAIREFSDKLPEYNVALFYYAGHGIHVNGENYLIPTDANLNKETDCQWDAISVNTIIKQFETVPENINIIILDACRDNPYKSWSRGAPQGFKMLNTVSGTFVAFATAEDATAADGEGLHGPFTEELVKQMVIPQSIFNVFIQTRNQVMKRTNNRQQPTNSYNLSGDFWFKR